MSGIVDGFKNQVTYAVGCASDFVEDVGVTMQKRIVHQTENARIIAIGFGNSCQQAANQTQQACLDTIGKIEEFLFQNKDRIFFVGCSLTTAYLVPQLFFPTMIGTIIIRVEISRNLKIAADHYLKDEFNPYKKNPNFETCLTTTDMTMGTIAAVDSIVMGILILPSTLTVSLIPVLGGIAAGNCVAKLGMNATHLLA